jgi:hypothetical protein
VSRRCLIFILALAGCIWLSGVLSLNSSSPVQPSSLFQWTLSNVRGLDPADAAQPTWDLLSIYLRRENEALSIRLDLLDHSFLPDYDLYIALDLAPGGSAHLPIDAQVEIEWDALLVIPANGKISVLGTDLQPIPRSRMLVWRDPTLDAVIIRLSDLASRWHLPRLQVFLCPAGERLIADYSAPTDAGLNTLQPARVWMAFTNAYPAYTPASALRRWNGAHTGPYGGSHGLAILLSAAQAENIPIALMDLKEPAALSALDTVGGLEVIRQMASEGLLILPESFVNLPSNRSTIGQMTNLQTQPTQAAREFGLPGSLFTYHPAGFANPQRSAPIIFTPAPINVDSIETSSPSKLSYTHLMHQGGQRILHLPTSADPQQATLNGPAIVVNQALIETALAANRHGGESALLILGGELPHSTWGASGAAQATFHYLRARPWIHFMNAADLQAMPAGAGKTNLQINSSEPAAPFQPALSNQQLAELFSALSAAPENALRQAAWQAYQALFAPVYPVSPQLPALRANYTGLVWSLLRAANWAQNPAPLTSCQNDPDQDGKAECILASEKIYAQFEIEPGGLSFLFSRETSPASAIVVHQWIAPTAQFIVGLSDPAFWDLSKGVLADPAVIPGAFFETGFNYSPFITQDKLIFFSADSSVQKTYTLQENGVRIEYQFAAAIPFRRLQAPFAIDPWQRFHPGWADQYNHSRLESGWLISDTPNGQPGLTIEIHSSAPTMLHSFNDSRPWMKRAENPNLDYPPGHYLPFPVLLLDMEISEQSGVIIDIMSSSP